MASHPRDLPRAAAPMTRAAAIRRCRPRSWLARAVAWLAVAAAAATVAATLAQPTRGPRPVADVVAEPWAASHQLALELAARPRSAQAAAAARHTLTEDQTALRELRGRSRGQDGAAARAAIVALSADAAWVDAVGSTIANPRSERRANLAMLARNASQATATPETGIGGTGHLLAATRRRPGA